MHTMTEERTAETGSERAKRTALLTKADLLRDGATVGTVRVRNMSASGLGGISSVPLREGDAIEIVINGIGAIGGEVVWADGDRFGMRFDHEVDLGALKMSEPVLAKRPDYFTYAKRFVTEENYRRPGLRSHH